MNDKKFLPELSDHETRTRAHELHAATLVLDSHIDIPWPSATGGVFTAETRRCVDLPKLRRGGVAAGCFAAFIPQGACDAAGHAAAVARTAAMLEHIRTMGGPGTRVASSAGAIEAAWSDGLPAIVPCVENGHAIGGDVANLAALRAAGVVYLTLTHNGHNALADSAVPRPDLGDEAVRHGGLSATGRDAVAEMNRLGMLIDVAHLSRAGMVEAAALSRAPIASTHSCARALCDHPRNLDDGQLDIIREVGGVVQVTTVSAFVRAHDKPDAVAVADVLDHIDYIARRIGIDHVGLGSDFDGGGSVGGWRHAGESVAVTAGLLARGYDAREIGLIWGGNFLRVLRACEARAAV